MNKPRFWILPTLGILVTPLFYLASFYTGRGPSSHAGGGFQMIAFFPIPFIISIFLGGVVGTILGAVQFPLFGLVLSYIREYKTSISFSLISFVIWFHITFSLITLALVFFFS